MLMPLLTTISIEVASPPTLFSKSSLTALARIVETEVDGVKGKVLVCYKL